MYFYPLDFTFVCPTEIIAFSDRIQEFKDIGCEVDTVNLWTRNISGSLECAVCAHCDCTLHAARCTLDNRWLSS